jgi:hypothetical protein
MVPHILNTILNIGIKNSFNAEAVRRYRLTNGLNITFALVAASAIPLLITLKNLSSIFIPIQFTCFLIYIYGLYLTKKNNLSKAQNLVVYTFEIQMAVICVLSLAKNSEGGIYTFMIYSFVIFPILAASVDRSILMHLLIALAMTLLFQVSALIFPSRIDWIIENYHIQSSSTTYLFTTLYLPLMVAALVSIIHRENINSKQLIQEEMVKQEKLNTQLVKEIENKNRAEEEKQQAENKLKAKVEELETMNKFMIGRELRMKELKEEIRKLQVNPI